MAYLCCYSLVLDPKFDLILESTAVNTPNTILKLALKNGWERGKEMCLDRDQSYVLSDTLRDLSKE